MNSPKRNTALARFIQRRESRLTRTAAKDFLRLLRKHAPRETFGVAFLKRGNGKLRRMRCQFGVRRGLTGTGRRFDPAYLNLFSVYAVAKREYRFISCERLRSITYRRKTYTVK